MPITDRLRRAASLQLALDRLDKVFDDLGVRAERLGKLGICLGIFLDHKICMMVVVRDDLV